MDFSFAMTNDGVVVTNAFSYTAGNWLAGENVVESPGVSRSTP